MVLCGFEIELVVVWGSFGRFGVVWGHSMNPSSKAKFRDANFTRHFPSCLLNNKSLHSLLSLCDMNRVMWVREWF